MKDQRLPPGYFYVGESIEIVSTIDQDTVDTTRIVIKDVSGSTVVDDSMTLVTNRVYNYIYDSENTVSPGNYYITMYFVSDTHTVITQERFILVSTDNNLIVNDDKIY